MKTNNSELIHSEGMKDNRTYSVQASSCQQCYAVGKRLQHLTASEALQELQKVSQNQPHNIFTDLIGFISRQDLMVLSYELIKTKPGHSTKHSKDKTLDTMRLGSIQKVSNLLQKGQFEFKPGHVPLAVTQIPKPGRSHKCGLTMASPRDKVVQKAIQLTLNAIFEPHFSPNSHGFRPNKSCHTALKQSAVVLPGVKWVIEAHISQCAHTINHKRLIQTLRVKINCTKTLALIARALKAGHVWPKLSPTEQAQGSILSPLLCNIYLDQLDQYVQQYCQVYRKGHHRPVHPTYHKRSKSLIQAYALPPGKQTTEHMGQKRLIRQTMPSGRLLRRPMDPNFRRMTWCRYADDLYIGIIGPKSDALTIQNDTNQFLKSLGLQLSETKTKLTHFASKPIMFLGALLQGTPLDGKYVNPTYGPP